MTTEKETAGRELAIVDRSELERNIGFVKAFLELLYGCHAGKMTDDLSEDLLYMISDAEGYLKKSLDLLSGAREASS
jgi:hypothetical protein